MRTRRREPSDAELNQRELDEQRRIRRALDGREERKRPAGPPGPHWYKDRNQKKKVTKG